MENRLTNGPWTIKQLLNGEVGLPKHNKTVFSCFHCGGGSSFGYKLAGYDVLGGVEIDPAMMKTYRANFNPKFSYEMPIQLFKKMTGIPKELFELDILDGSPPCSSFSMAGNREKDWGTKRKFREGQADQVLDDLFFDFIDVAKMLNPKIVVAENVKGLIQGNARGYVKEIFMRLDDAGYYTQLFLLNSAFMGVPQRRERTFFIARRKDLGFGNLVLNFNEPLIPFEQIEEKNVVINNDLSLSETAKKYWYKCEQGKSFSSVHEKGSLFNWIKVHPKRPLNTLAASNIWLNYHYGEPRCLTNNELINGQTFPLDYKFEPASIGFVIGMSVPPFMMQRISSQIYEQWLK